ncbi:MAG: SCP2 sterol-binding domain-containing protein [Myxococcales bacterium]|nr:SCP2 sterol-binding domain-containing protein [Myxococcales bacterium]
MAGYTQAVAEKVGEDSGLGSTLKFAFNEGGFLFIDGKSTPNRVHNDDEAAQCTVKVSLDDFGKLMDRQLDPMTAFMGGKLKIEGDMGVAMKLGRLFQG